MLLGSIEAGGTKFICAIGNEKHQILNQTRIQTTTPKITLRQVINYFKQFPNLQAISIASFGPIDIQKATPQYGYITKTPKPGWSNTNFLGIMKAHFSIPMFWTTDVNASAYGEHINLAINNLTYLTIGTGVGAGAIVNGQLLSGTSHPEIGHMKIKRHPADFDFQGICPFHHDCLEGLCAVPSFEARLGIQGPEVPLDHPVWDLMAYYIAQADINITLFLRPAVIVLGGGVMNKTFLKQIQTHFIALNHHYTPIKDVSHYIMMPTIAGNHSATVGNFSLAQQALSQAKRNFLNPIKL